MDPLTMALIGAGVGGLKSELFDRPAAEQKQRSQFITMRYSPWTGRNAGPIVDNPNQGNAMLSGAMTGLQFGLMNPGMGGAAGALPTSQAMPSQVAAAPVAQPVTNFSALSTRAATPAVATPRFAPMVQSAPVSPIRPSYVPQSYSAPVYQTEAMSQTGFGNFWK